MIKSPVFVLRKLKKAFRKKFLATTRNEHIPNIGTWDDSHTGLDV